MADNVIVKVGEKEWLRGEDGFDPVVTVEDIEHGHRVTITDREHPVEGRSFDVMDGASAYEQAVAGGYEGTEEEFNADLADFSEKEQATTNAAAAAAQSEQNAADSATAATTKAQEAVDSAAAALTRMNSANSSAQAAANSASSAEAAKMAAQAAQNEAEYARADAIAAANAAGGYSSQARQAIGQAQIAMNAAQRAADSAAASAAAASNSATEAANSAAAAGDAKTEAETAQAAAESARDTTITTLQTEGAAQRTAIQQKGAETLASIPEDYTDLTEDVSDLKSALNKITTKKQTVVDNVPNQLDGVYWRIHDGIINLSKKYLLEFVPNTTFVQSNIKTGTEGAAASMVHTIVENYSFTNGVAAYFDFTPSTTTERYIRVNDSNANKFSSVKLIEVQLEIKSQNQIDLNTNDIEISNHSENQFSNRIAETIKEVNAIKASIDNGISSLIKVKTSEGTSKTVTIPSVGAHDKYILRVGLHYGSAKYTPSANEVFMDEQCEKDFSDIRFFLNGKMLKARLGCAYNIEPLEDAQISISGGYALSTGQLIGYSETYGILISTARSNGHTFTAIANTAHVADDKPSAVNHIVSMMPVFVDEDDNIFAYAGGILYKLLVSDGYATKQQVLDFSWDNSGTMVYPDIQSHAIAKDINGIMYCGTYSSHFHTDIFVSSNGGTSWSLSYHDYNGGLQHTHHIHADPYTGKVYVGVDDGSSTYNGSHILVTDDGGDTWVDITANNHQYRGRDYYPTYFGDGYRLGGGETYLMGDATIYRSIDDVWFDRPVKGFSGVRSFGDFGNDDLIIAGVNQTDGTTENQILTSVDKGKTWQTLYRKEQSPISAAGWGFRDCISNITIAGDTEPCVLVFKDAGNVKNMRIYKDGNHYYREAYILLENIENEDINLTISTGYLMAYPYNDIYGYEADGLVYHLPLNEGMGNIVTDSTHQNKSMIGVDYEWHNNEDAMRYGDVGGDDRSKPLYPSAGLKVLSNDGVNLGVIESLDFSKSYTITFWFNADGWLMEATRFESRITTPYQLFKFGDVKFYMRNYGFGCGTGSEPHNNGSGMACPAASLGYLTQYVFVAMVIDSSNHVTVYENGCVGNSQVNNGSPSWAKLNAGNFVLVNDEGYLSDIKVYNKELTANEIMSLYRGY